MCIITCWLSNKHYNSTMKSTWTLHHLNHVAWLLKKIYEGPWKICHLSGLLPLARLDEHRASNSLHSIVSRTKIRSVFIHGGDLLHPSCLPWNNVGSPIHLSFVAFPDQHTERAHPHGMTHQTLHSAPFVSFVGHTESWPAVMCQIGQRNHFEECSV